MDTWILVMTRSCWHAQPCEAMQDFCHLCTLHSLQIRHDVQQILSLLSYKLLWDGLAQTNITAQSETCCPFGKSKRLCRSCTGIVFWINSSLKMLSSYRFCCGSWVTSRLIIRLLPATLPKWKQETNWPMPWSWSSFQCWHAPLSWISIRCWMTPVWGPWSRTCLIPLRRSKVCLGYVMSCYRQCFQINPLLLSAEFQCSLLKGIILYGAWVLWLGRVWWAFGKSASADSIQVCNCNTSFYNIAIPASLAVAAVVLNNVLAEEGHAGHWYIYISATLPFMLAGLTQRQVCIICV